VNRQPVTVRVARWSATHPWLAILAWIAFVVLSLVGGSAAGTRNASVEDSAIGESGRASVMVERAGFADPVVENVLITSRTGALDQAAGRSTADQVMQRVRGLPVVAKVEGPVPSPDGNMLMVHVTLTGDPETSAENVVPVLDATAAVQREHPDLRVEQVGPGSLDKALSETLGKDFEKAELISLPLTLLILLVAFGALIAAGVPVLLALSAVGAAIGLNSLASHLLPSTDGIATIILLMGMAVGVDYSLFYLRREREERVRGRGHVDAVEVAAATSGHAVVVSGLAVMVSMAGLYIAGDVTFSSMATGAILVVAVAVIGSLTVLPALLAKLGRWVDRPRIPFVWRLSAARQGPPRLWPALLRPALKYPAVTLVVAVAALLALATPALGMKLKLPGLEDLPRKTAAMQAFDRMTAAFPSTGTAHEVVVRAPADKAEQVRAAVNDLTGRIAAEPLYARDDATPPRVSPDGRVTVVTVGTPYAMRSEEAKRSLERLRDDLVPNTVGRVDGAEYAVGGLLGATLDFSDHVKGKLPWVMAFVLGLTFLIMAVTFRSVVIAVTSIALNMLSVGAAYGLLVLVFQNTWAENLLGFTSIDAVVAWLPLFLFVVLFGLSMDYHVFVVSRIREAFRGGMSNRAAVAHGITSSAGVVTSAAIVMVGVFSVFATLSMIDLKQLGVGLAAAILIDATIIRAVVLPSLMTVLGNANWWAPAFLRRRSEPEPNVPAAGPEEREMQPVA
jgi:putative drug exporter of the RND superfamily